MPGRFNGKIEKYIELSFLEWNLYFEHTGFGVHCGVGGSFGLVTQRSAVRSPVPAT